ncbi:hypothetical protein [Anaerotalea alkaliphila]|uniref:Iron-only hydrogenase system regulator n=1 Tax=Anaerotalea alkaliphila TaxID=2662126 RepID=A0A7X5HWE6_9FIRM|nr:hypothetical protein [Anaerotalea alkaliphila]NDL67873.1 hypothetical protein [Anaerotalea alkaliphila]
MAKIIMGIKVDHRQVEAAKLQQLLTEYGCIIKTRLGLHNASEKGTECSEDGLILLEFIADADADVGELEGKLGGHAGVHVEKMVF